MSHQVDLEEIAFAGHPLLRWGYFDHQDPSDQPGYEAVELDLGCPAVLVAQRQALLPLLREPPWGHLVALRCCFAMIVGSVTLLSSRLPASCFSWGGDWAFCGFDISFPFRNRPEKNRAGAVGVQKSTLTRVVLLLPWLLLVRIFLLLLFRLLSGLLLAWLLLTWVLLLLLVRLLLIGVLLILLLSHGESSLVEKAVRNGLPCFQDRRVAKLKL